MEVVVGVWCECGCKKKMDDDFDDYTRKGLFTLPLGASNQPQLNCDYCYYYHYYYYYKIYMNIYLKCIR